MPVGSGGECGGDHFAWRVVSPYWVKAALWQILIYIHYAILYAVVYA